MDGLVLPPERRELELQVDGRRLRLSNLDRVLWPRTGFTKGEMIDYYARIASVLLPHLAGRPLTLWRFPEGVEGPNWFQTQCRGRPEWLPTASLPGRGGAVQHYCLVNDVPSLLWVANLGTIELHPFLACADRPGRPLVAVFDLDPGAPASLADCCGVALLVREVLDGLGLASLPKTSGAKGLQVYVPLNVPHDYAETKRFARSVARRLAEERPDLVLDVPARAERRGKVFIDWSQNDERKSTVAPYSLRGRPAPTVSTPVTWEEVQGVAARDAPEHLSFQAPEVLARAERLGDLFGPVLDLSQRLPE